MEPLKGAMAEDKELQFHFKSLNHESPIMSCCHQFAVVALILTAWASTCCLAQTGPGVSCLCLQELYGRGLYDVTTIVNANDTSGRLYLGEQRGLVWTVSDGAVLPTPFLNLSSTDLLLTEVTGLLNFAFHPSYTSNGLIYVHYAINSSVDNEFYQRISEFQRSSSDPDVIDVSTERVLMDVYQERARGGHQGGGILFGSDSYLYITLGDMFCCADPNDQGQNKSTLQGTIIRIDVDSPDLPYGIPPDNPFLGEPGTRPEIYAYGLRNPYTAGIDRGNRNTGVGRGRIFMGEVGDGGSEHHEEVNELFAGGNYGWPVWEGETCLRPEECDSIGPVVDPAVYYNRTLGSCVILANVYRGCQNPDLEGWLMYADLTTTYVMGATEVSPNDWQYEVIPMCAVCPDGLTNVFHESVISGGEDEAGEIYFGSGDYDPITGTSSIYKIVDPNNPGTPCALGGT